METYTHTPKSYIYTPTAATRIFKKQAIATFERLPKSRETILIIFEDGSEIEVSKQIFEKHFKEFRKQKAETLSPEFDPITNQWNVLGHQGIIYQIKSEPQNCENIECNCPDWKIQKELGIPTPICKHGYAVINNIKQIKHTTQNDLHLVLA